MVGEKKKNEPNSAGIYLDVVAGAPVKQPQLSLKVVLFLLYTQRALVAQWNEHR